MVRDGEICVVQEKKFEWKIKRFLELPNRRCESPEFSFSGTTWTIWIYPHGDSNDGSANYVDLYISPTAMIKPITLDYSFHLKTAAGKVDKSEEFIYTFEEPNYGWGCSELISRSELLERKSELLPSGTLTVICTMKKGEINNVAGDEPVNVSKFTQTEGGTGIWKLQEQLKEISLNGNVSDVVLKVDKKEFKSHRCVLAARSAVFLAMLTHETKEKNTGVVDIEDVGSNTFSDFLCYLYTGNEEIITSENVVKLFTAADKYQVGELKKSCLDYMLKNITVDNFCDVLSLSLDHLEKDLTDACSRFFIRNSLAIVKTPEWLIFVTKNPVASNELHIKQLENNQGKREVILRPKQISLTRPFLTNLNFN